MTYSQNPTQVAAHFRRGNRFIFTALLRHQWALINSGQMLHPELWKESVPLPYFTNSLSQSIQRPSTFKSSRWQALQAVTVTTASSPRKHALIINYTHYTSKPGSWQHAVGRGASESFACNHLAYQNYLPKWITWGSIGPLLYQGKPALWKGQVHEQLIIFKSIRYANRDMLKLFGSMKGLVPNPAWSIWKASVARTCRTPGLEPGRRHCI